MEDKATLKIDINDDKYQGLVAAINTLLRPNSVGDMVGFRIGNKHFTVTRDE